METTIWYIGGCIGVRPLGQAVLFACVAEWLLGDFSCDGSLFRRLTLIFHYSRTLGN